MGTIGDFVATFASFRSLEASKKQNVSEIQEAI